MIPALSVVLAFAQTAAGPCVQLAARFDVVSIGPRIGLVPSDSINRLAAVNNADFAGPAVLTVRCPDDWSVLWDQLLRRGRFESVPATVPPIDFGRQAVVIVALGVISHGNTVASLDSFVRFERALVVYVSRADPEPACGVLGSIVSHADALAVPVVRTDLVLVETRRLVRC